MRSIRLIDFFQRRVNSILFRIVLACYALFVLVVNENAFSTSLYFLLFVAYAFIYVYSRKSSTARLINDYVFIFSILFNKDVTEVINFSLIILPLLNAINFSGTKKTSLLYIICSITFISADFLYRALTLHQREVFTRDLVLNFLPILFFLVIDYYTSLRSKLRNFKDELNEVIEDYYITRGHLKQPHKIYRFIIHTINRNIKSDFIQNVICIAINPKVEKNKFIFINGSLFVLNIEFGEPETVERISEGSYLANMKMDINGESANRNFIIKTEIDERKYVYVFLTKYNIPFYYSLIGFHRILEPTLYKVSNLLLSEEKVHQLRMSEIQKQAERVQYVNRANKIMHFIRNRLGPLNNLLSMLDRRDKVPVEKVVQFNQIVSDETARVKVEIRTITDRATDMLEKSGNPFAYENTKDVAVILIIIRLRQYYYNYFPERSISIKSDAIHIGRKKTKINLDGFEEFISDWVTNMSKYSNGNVNLEIAITEESMKIVFSNNHQHTQEDIGKLIDDLMNNDRIEIVKRKTYGIFAIKSILDAMNIKFRVHDDSVAKMLYFEVDLNIFQR